MIRAEDLRIGNLVNVKLHIPIPVKIKAITETSISCEGIERNRFTPFLISEKLEPIPLTEDILLKCGFKNESKGWVSLNNYLFEFDCLCVGINEGYVWIEYGGRYDLHACNLTKNIKYLHELQNLYYALTKQELDITKILEDE